MSGGHFDYKQFAIFDIAEEIKNIVDHNKDETKNEYGDRLGRFYSDEIIEEFKNAIYILKLAHTYAQRIDWLLSGDDGCETFLERLYEEITKIKQDELKEIDNE